MSDEERFLSYVLIPTVQGTCWEWVGGKNQTGYGQFSAGGVNVRAHKWSFEHFNARRVNGCLLHSCDNPSCVNPDHLREGSHADNYKDSVARGRNSKGERHGMSKLTAAAVDEIRASTGVRQVDLASKYGVTQQVISKVINRKAWV